tara:strand:- start:236 stop:1150 length:915 start_codon:yes stop_codon:yes gene_type:complete
MAYGDLKVNNLIYDTGSGDATRTVLSIPQLASPTFTGTVTVPTPTAGDNSTKAATTAFVATSFAPLASPTLTGTPAAPTAAANTNTTQIATTAFVMTELGDYATLAAPAFTGTATGVNLTLSGNLTVNGTTTTIDTTNLDVEDKNITLGKVSTPSDTTADGGGLTLKGATDKTFNWVNSTDSWTSSESIEVAAGKFFKDDKGNLRSIPANAQSSAHVAVAADAGKAIYISTGGVTLNNSVFSAGDAVTIINNSGSDQTITQGSGVTLHNSADASSGNRTLAARGMATVWFASASVGYISGAGLS